ncbi:MAG: protoheme IX farnesyltransferase [Bdellovibrionales bacterium]
MNWLRAYLKLTKTGIVVFTLISALAGYAVAFQPGQEFDLIHLLLLLVGLYATAAGSFAINQAQEWRRDLLMDRTAKRPIPAGLIRPWQAYAVGVLLVVSGLGGLTIISDVAAKLALLTVILYNLIYTLFWKRYWAFGAVPGAIPGAMPVVIGYAVNEPEFWQPECAYLFLVMFLWQMPHFWALAIRFREDYEKGGFPVLPVRLGVNRALFHIGLYVFTYVGVAVMSPWFLQAHMLYLFLVLPISAKVVWEFFKYYRSTEAKAWLPFFLWVNMSLLVYLAVPVLDKWLTWAWRVYA